MNQPKNKRPDENADRRLMSIDKIPQALAKTGFPLELKVANSFRKAGFGVITNRYYVDDVDGKSKELDLIAYKFTKGRDLDVVTAVLTSCKKDSENSWVFMSTKKEGIDPNIESNPLHVWTDCEPLSTFLKNEDWKSLYLQRVQGLSELFEATRQVFGMQLTSANGDAPKNDRSMFDSISGLMKALDHELSILPKRVAGRKRIYQINLLTIVDAPLVDVSYDAEPSAMLVDSLSHITSYIVNRSYKFGLLRFASASRIDAEVARYETLSRTNLTAFVEAQDNAYEAIKSNAAVQTYFAAKLLPKVRFIINGALQLSGDDRITELSIHYDKERSVLVLRVDGDAETIQAANDNEKALDAIRVAVKALSRYEGEVEMEMDFPF